MGIRDYRRHGVIWLLACLLIGGCGRSSPQLTALPQEAVILAFGDSLTFGTGATSDESYPAVLSSLIGRHVVNSGIPGELSAEGLQRLPAVLDSVKPKLLILCHGGNDLLRKRDKRELKSNLAAMTKAARERGIDVLLLGVPEPTLLMRRTSGVYLELAEELGLPIEAETLARIESDDALKSDAVHPNAQGYQILARAVAEVLRESGGIH